MHGNTLTREVARETLEAMDRCGSQKDAAKDLGIAQSTLSERMTRIRKNGWHLSDGMQESMVAAKLDGMTIDGGWIITDKDGEIIKRSTRYSAKDDGGETLLDRVATAFADIPAAPDVAAPQHTLDDLLTIYPLADVHMGMQAWGQETGDDYDTKIAVGRVTSWVGQAVASSPASETAIILDVGDLHHGDDQTNMTPRSKHILDVDTRHFKTLDMSIYALATSVDLARAKHARVIVRILPGNHNPTSYMAVMFALAERYRNDDCVEVQKVPGEFFTHEFGKCLIAAHHGDKAKAERMVMFLADEYAEAWGRTRHRYLWTGHLHHHKSADIGGVTWEQLRAVTARDAYAASHAYVARSQLQAITYHRDLGEVQRVKISGP